MATYWRDLIEIPEAVQASDFVLKLNEGVARAQQTIDSYVVTDGVSDAFDHALALISGALEKNSSSATYLHGSFGSGKSHFMAVLGLALDPSHRAMIKSRSVALANIMSKHKFLNDDRKLMMVPYHFLGAESMEHCVLGGYVQYIQSEEFQREHPGAPIPPVYRSEKLLENAADMRSKIGDAAFFSMLGGSGGGAPADDGWGTVAAASWDTGSFEAASALPPSHPERQRLVSDLIVNVFSSMVDYAAASERGGGFVSLDEGLSIISKHAKSLGFDGVVLFMDELILWLSRRASDSEFIQRESQKLAKLVEAQHADRPAPIISFVARQRTLVDFVGEAYTGLEKTTFDFQLNWIAGRFNKITLEDSDLPEIVSKRLIRPKTPADGEAIAASFERMMRGLSNHHRDMMLTRDSDDVFFSKIYPFSPALVESLIVLSTYLQSRRTSLRLMLQLLVEHRDSLTLGEIVPVGDLWDVVTAGDTPFNDELRRPYQQAVDLWKKKLRPMLAEKHGVNPDKLEAGTPAAIRWRNEARLLKTLLLATLIPEVGAFRDMTIAKLAALNYSAVLTPMPGMQDDVVAARVRDWAATVPELKVAVEGGSRAAIKLELSTFDVDLLLDQVRTEDNMGARTRKVRDLLYGWTGVTRDKNSKAYVELDWRGARRRLDVEYANVRKLSSEAIEGKRGWLALIDYPFDEPNHYPNSDVQKLESFGRENPEGVNTLAWLPRFLTETGQRLLARLVLVEYVLERFAQFSTKYPESERENIRQQLESQRSALRSKLKESLLSAYGLSARADSHVDMTHKLDRHIHSLRVNHAPRLSGGLGFAEALRQLFKDALTATYPDALRIADEALTPGKARKLYEVVQEAAEAEGGRVRVDDKNMRALLKHYAEPARLGRMGETNFALESQWDAEIERALSAADGAPTVGLVRDVVEPPDAPRGTPRLIQDLIIATYALTHQMELRQMGTRAVVELGKLSDTITLHDRALPSEEDFGLACEIAAEVFGATVDLPLRTAANVDTLAKLLKTSTLNHRQSVYELVANLRGLARVLGIPGEKATSCDRMLDALALNGLLERLHTLPPTEAIDVLAEDMRAHRAKLATQYERITSLNATARDSLVNSAFSRAVDARDTLSQPARDLLTRAQAIYTTHEYIEDLDQLRGLADRMLGLLVGPGPRPGPTPDPVPRPGPTKKTWNLNSEAELDAALGELREALKQGATLTVSKEPGR